MLNLSTNRIKEKITESNYRSFSMLKDTKSKRIYTRLLIGFFVALAAMMFLPWTQNITAKGFITTLKPNQRPQTINSIIPGRIEEWFVREGNFVEKGDTLLFISEIKDAYFDPNLVGQARDQVKAKTGAVASYKEKVSSIENQLKALKETRKAKLSQAENYVQKAKLNIVSDSTDLLAANLNEQIAERQFLRIEELYNSGLKSLTDYENARQKFQEQQAKRVSAQNKLNASRNELQVAVSELVSLENQFLDKIAKAQSDKFSTLSAQYNAEASLSKLENQLKNYSVRSNNYYLTAPQAGYINKLLKAGIGEVIKEGEVIAQIMPKDYDLAVSMFIEPKDMPLIHTGQKVQFIFDGWPTIAFSGWPNLSFGTYPGEIIAVDQYISDNGKYRILVVPKPGDEPWPNELRVGSGARGIALLKDVPIWYELWRQLNGFPPDYYQQNKKLKK